MKSSSRKRNSPQRTFFKEHGIIAPRGIIAEGMLMAYVNGTVAPAVGTTQEERVAYILELQGHFAGKTVRRIRDGACGTALSVSVLPSDRVSSGDCLGVDVRWGEGCNHPETIQEIELVVGEAAPTTRRSNKVRLGSRLARRFPST